MCSDVDDALLATFVKRFAATSVLGVRMRAWNEWTGWAGGAESCVATGEATKHPLLHQPQIHNIQVDGTT